MKPRYTLLIAGLSLTFLSAPSPATSHPLGSLAIDHYSRLRVTSQSLRLRYVIDMAEIPTFQEMPQVDTDGDRRASAAEQRAYLERKIRDLAARLPAALNGKALEWRIESSHLTGLSDGGPPTVKLGLPTIRILVDLRAEFPAGSPKENTILYQDVNFPERSGWKEIVVEADPGIRLLKSSAPLKDISNELTRYPVHVTAPPQDLTAEFTFQTRAGAGLIGTFQRALREQGYLWLMVAVAALTLAIRYY